MTKITTMKKRIFLLPIILLASLVIFNWGCGEEENEEDLCLFVDISEYYPQCESPTICCPTDENQDCYIVNPDGENFMCDADLATEGDEDGCAEAENAYIDAYCITGKMSASDIEGLKIQLSRQIKQLMIEASRQSLCF